MKEAGGYKLFLSRKNPTGYVGVQKQAYGRFQAKYYDGASDDNNHVSLGRFNTAIEAAVAYAKYRAEAGPRTGRSGFQTETSAIDRANGIDAGWRDEEKEAIVQVQEAVAALKPAPAASFAERLKAVTEGLTPAAPAALGCGGHGSLDSGCACGAGCGGGSLGMATEGGCRFGSSLCGLAAALTS